MFLCDHAEFTQVSFAQQPLPPLAGKWGKRLAAVGANPVGNVFLKKADIVTRTNPLGKTVTKNGLLNSGRTIRKTPLALVGLGLAGYGTYRAKKVYDKYKPEIKMGRKIMRNYNALKNRFSRGEE